MFDRPDYEDGTVVALVPDRSEDPQQSIGGGVNA